MLALYNVTCLTIASTSSDAGDRHSQVVDEALATTLHAKTKGKFLYFRRKLPVSSVE